MMFFGFATETTEITNFFGNCQWNLSLLCINIFFVKAMEANSGSDKAMTLLRQKIKAIK
jgi:hypothetical protein